MKTPEGRNPSGLKRENSILRNTSEIEAIRILLKPTTKGFSFTAEGDGNLVDGYVGTDDCADPCLNGLLLFVVVECAALADLAFLVQPLQLSFGEDFVVGIHVFWGDTRPRASAWTKRSSVKVEQIAKSVFSAVLLEA